ncbi:MAG TPA: tRNA (adenosine(37)-N6)-threonylcarbamoyltransferase complex ATPase subunit type 1 TsaE [Rhodospirillaceae bacterium]|nr:tRNA (adenosine(37)-N6)-threonylcarbamoyltransferase complex ATPase subunit type 1 TsaE [Rhodospirillaceae bacterium]
MIHTANTEGETGKIAADLAAKTAPGDIVFLRGALGAGKTVFARNFIRALSGQPQLEVPSPTFTLVQTYDAAGRQLWHFDLYRLEDPEEIYELGWEEALSEGGIVLVEWPERLGNLKPPRYMDIHIRAHDNDSAKRTIEITHHDSA